MYVLAAKTGKVVTVEEHSIIGGLGSAVAEVIAEKQPAKLLRIGVEDRFGESGPALKLLRSMNWMQQVSTRRLRHFIKYKTE